jgi:hypothetical protein
MVSADFRKLIAGTKAREGQRRVGAGEDHQMHLRRQVVEEKRDSVVHRLGRDKVIVIQDEDIVCPWQEGSISPGSGDLVDQHSQNGFRRRWLRRLEQSARDLPSVGMNHLQRGDQVSEETRQVVVTRVEGEPCGRVLTF